MDSIKGKVVVITGASSGIGATTAKLFASYGAKLALVGRHRERLEEVGQQCRDEGLEEDDLCLIFADLLKESDVKKVATETLEQFNTVHSLINNAGVGSPGDIESMVLDDLDKMYKLNVRAPCQLVKLFLAQLKENKGNVVNVSSIAAHTPLPRGFSFSVAKGAMSHMSKTMALQLCKSGVRVNAISPGDVKTGILRSTGIVKSEEEEAMAHEMMGAMSPFGRSAEPEEISQSILFLASDASSYISGQDILVDAANNLTSVSTCNSLMGGDDWQPLGLDD